MLRPNSVNVNTSPYFSRHSKKKRYGFIPYDTAEPTTGTQWNTRGGSDLLCGTHTWYSTFSTIDSTIVPTVSTSTSCHIGMASKLASKEAMLVGC